MIVCVPVTVEGQLGLRWGRADRVAVATVGEEGIEKWQEFDVGWGDLHVAGTEDSHHACIAIAQAAWSSSEDETTSLVHRLDGRGHPPVRHKYAGAAPV